MYQIQIGTGANHWVHLYINAGFPLAAPRTWEGSRKVAFWSIWTETWGLLVLLDPKNCWSFSRPQDQTPAAPAEAQRLRSACAARCRLGMFKQWQANLDHGDIKKIVLGYDILGCERGSFHSSMTCWGSNLTHPETNGQCHPFFGRGSLNNGRSMTFHDFLFPSDI